MLADDIAELKIGYFGRDAGAADVDAPTWRDRWDDPQRLPLLMRIDVKPRQGRRLADARRRAARARPKPAAAAGTRRAAAASGGMTMRRAIAAHCAPRASAASR